MDSGLVRVRRAWGFMGAQSQQLRRELSAHPTPSPILSLLGGSSQLPRGPFFILSFGLHNSLRISLL